MNLVVATKNKNKLREIKNILKNQNITIVSQDEIENFPEIIEDGTTFEENALKKARTIAKATGMITMADDSGLTIDALHGEPGIYSARYSGKKANDEENINLVLHKMQNIPVEKRSAAFICVIAIVTPDENEYTVCGKCTGIITNKPQGFEGFGYDPIFYLNNYGKTMAEIPIEEKNKISHRAIALEKAVDLLKQII